MNNEFEDYNTWRCAKCGKKSSYQGHTTLNKDKEVVFYCDGFDENGNWKPGEYEKYFGNFKK